MSGTTVTSKPTLFDTNTKEINPYWIDPNQPLQVPNNPLHWHAHKLQLLLHRMDRQIENNPAQFNSGNYQNILDKFTAICEAINNGKESIDDVHDQPTVEKDRNAGSAAQVGDGASSSVDTGVSADNPFAG